jgi:hypothetical protein
MAKNSKNSMDMHIVLLLWSFSAKGTARYRTREGSIEVIGSYRIP